MYLCRLQLTLVSELKYPVHKAILESITAKQYVRLLSHSCIEIYP